MRSASPSPSAEPSAEPSGPTRSHGLSGLTDWIRVGQVVITVLLLVVATVRASLDAVPPVWTIAVALVFAGWYFGGLLLASRTRDHALAAWWLLGLGLVWAGAVVVSAEFVWVAFSLWMLAGFVLPLRWAIPFSLVALAVVIAAPVVHRGTTSYANVLGPLVGAAFALGLARGYLQLIRDAHERRALIASLVQAHHELASLQDELARSQRESGALAERTRLSRDIHDTVAQSVSSIGMLARSALDTGTGEHARRALEQIEQLSHEGLADTRRIVNALIPAELETGALAGALQRMLERLRDERSIAVELHVDDAFPALPTATEVALLRTAQSALANVRSHAHAQRVVVTLSDTGDTVRLDVADDGTGFDVARWEGRATESGGYGLRSMRERLRELGGGLDIESDPGEGTALSAHLPLAAAGRDAR